MVWLLTYLNPSSCRARFAEIEAEESPEHDLGSIESPRWFIFPKIRPRFLQYFHGVCRLGGKA